MKKSIFINRNINVILFGLLVFSMLEISCTTTGHFTSNPRDRMAHAGSEFILTKQDSFHLRSWTDVYTNYVDSLGNRIWKENKYRGYGTYVKEKDSLHLEFTNVDSIQVQIYYENIGSTKKYEIQFFDELGRDINSEFRVVNKQEEILEYVILSLSKNHTLTFEEQENPAQLILMGFSGSRIFNPIIELDQLDEGHHVFNRKSYNGYFSKGDQLTIWFKPVFTGIRYEFRGRKRYKPKKWKWGFLNRFYRDY